jgi:sulfopyruvate decarboxylase alpha subunit
MGGEGRQEAWHEVLRDTFRKNGVRLVAYVPDQVLSPLIEGLNADPEISVIAPTREEEAVGIVTGAWLGGMLGAVMMQTSGFATIVNALASLAVPYQVPLIIVVSERGTLGEFNAVQTVVPKTVRPALEAMGIEYHTLRRLDELAFVADRAIRQAVMTQAPVALILNPMLTGGKAG